MPWRELRAAVQTGAQRRHHQHRPCQDGAGRARGFQLHGLAPKYPSGPEGPGAMASSTSSWMPRCPWAGIAKVGRGAPPRVQLSAPGTGYSFLVPLQEREELGRLYLCGERGPRTHPGCGAPLPGHRLGWEGNAPASTRSTVAGPPAPVCPCDAICWHTASLTLLPGRPALGSHWAMVKPSDKGRSALTQRWESTLLGPPSLFLTPTFGIPSPLGSHFSLLDFRPFPTQNSQCGGGREHI